ncbi:hypothetical protein PIROE2DRAFT_52852 [Piromyces sp. E2]|nr:hypothetical protein PIROE2DRAFT_52852 [Piromyces sp. E2]|eukprot:OUM69975.1 hypothetical protein PIROE2DRAFT_52852 [Piromyces sp. E2]
MQQNVYHWPLYVIEFKAGRTDYFYVPENSGLTIKIGDLVIVEADRGKDLGKVIVNNIKNLAQLAAEGDKVSEENLQFPKDIHPKRIYRMAQPAEVNMLVQKNTDENSSMLLCQQKVRQRNMPMEVVDAEYQWDRRKLTFYFVSERRIDFRELVRDLFKVYKTRIWMCAVSSLTTMKAYQAFNINIVSPSNMTEQTIAQLQNMTIEDKKEGEDAATSIEANAEKKEDGENKVEEVKEEGEKKEEIKEEMPINAVAEIKSEVKEANLDVVNTATKVPVQTPTPPPSLPPSQVQTPK